MVELGHRDTCTHSSCSWNLHQGKSGFRSVLNKCGVYKVITVLNIPQEKAFFTHYLLHAELRIKKNRYRNPIVFVRRLTNDIIYIVLYDVYIYVYMTMMMTCTRLLAGPWETNVLKMYQAYVVFLRNILNISLVKFRPFCPSLNRIIRPGLCFYSRYAIL